MVNHSFVVNIHLLQLIFTWNYFDLIYSDCTHGLVGHVFSRPWLHQKRLISANILVIMDKKQYFQKLLYFLNFNAKSYTFDIFDAKVEDRTRTRRVKVSCWGGSPSVKLVQYSYRSNYITFRKYSSILVALFNLTYWLTN